MQNTLWGKQLKGLLNKKSTDFRLPLHVFPLNIGILKSYIFNSGSFRCKKGRVRKEITFLALLELSISSGSMNSNTEQSEIVFNSKIYIFTI